MTRQLVQPTSELVGEYVNRFDRENEAVEKALSTLFQTFPANCSLPDVLLKVVAVNALYSTNIFATYQVAEHIVRLGIDSKLASRSFDVVEQIAKNEIGGKERRFYSFATKYCSWHLPDSYPIYDSLAERLLWAYLKRDEFAQVQRSDLQEYSRYTDVVERFRDHYGLSEFSFKNIDKFLWLYGQEVFSPADTGFTARTASQVK